MAESTVSVPVLGPDLTPHMFGWLVPVAIGVPGNIFVILIAGRKHNRNLSPCIYMLAMSISDTVLLLEMAWAVIFNGYLLREGVLESATWVMK